MSFKIGDRVYSLTRGWGTVTTKDEVALYGLVVDFLGDRGTSIYTLTGKRFDDDLAPELYHGEPEIIAPPEPDRRPKLEVDDKILVKANANNEWAAKHFKAWDVLYGVNCWNAGQTSWTTTYHQNWPFWKLPE